MRSLLPLRLLPLLLLPLLVACQPGADGLVDPSNLIVTVGGFSGPEAVRYDAETDQYFVSNFNGGGGDRDANGFISTLSPEGEIGELRFMTGTAEHPMHAPRGLFVVGDTLWAADADGLHGFDKRTGAHLAFRDLTAFDLGFVNDVVAGPDGALYATDTGKDRVYRVTPDTAEIALEDPVLGRPNGITWDAANERFLIVPFGGAGDLFAWTPGTDPTPIARSEGSGFDGVEVLPDGRLLVASQGDGTLHLFEGETGRAYVKTAGSPADIGVDTQRQRVAVPFVALDEVEIWQLPDAEPTVE